RAGFHNIRRAIFAAFFSRIAKDFEGNIWNIDEKYFAILGKNDQKWPKSSSMNNPFHYSYGLVEFFGVGTQFKMISEKYISLHNCHASGGWHPDVAPQFWMPASAGMTIVK